MHVLITGGAGFLGQLLMHELLRLGTLVGPTGELELIRKITLLDVSHASVPDDARVHAVAGNMTDIAVLRSVISQQTATIFHLASVVSGQAESEFDLGMSVNLDATRMLLDTCRAANAKPRVVFTSSVAVYGGTLPDMVNDSTALNPQSSYGTQKAIGELLLSDYHRKGFIDGRVARLPTISIRPGKPNQAASSFASGVIREPLHGLSAICPVSSTTRIWLMSPNTAIACLIAVHDLPSQALGRQRAINLPGISISAGEMVEALRRVAGDQVASLIRWVPDAQIERIVGSWPSAWSNARALELGMPADTDFDDVIRTYLHTQALQAAPANPLSSPQSIWKETL